MRFKALALAALLFACALRAAAAPERLPVHLLDAETDAGAFPIRMGVPFPKGRLATIDRLRVVDATGRVLASDVKRVSSWDDGSVRWALLAFQADVAGGAAGPRVFIEYGPEVRRRAPGKGVSVTSRPGEIVVDTGRIRAVFSRKGNGPLVRRLAYDANADGAYGADEEALDARGATHGMAVLNADTRRVHGLATRLKSVVVESKGTRQVTIKATGSYRRGKVDVADFIIRCYFYHRKAFARIDHVFVYRSDPEKDFIRDLHFRFHLAPRLRARAALSGKSVTARKVTLLQHWWEAYRVMDGAGAQIGAGDRFDGIASVRSAEPGGAGLALVVRNFWQQYPKAFSIDRDKGVVEIGLWPASLNRCLDLRRYSDTVYTEPPDYETHPTGPSRSAQGMAVPHRFFLSFGPAERPARETKALADLLRRPPVPYVSGEWYRETDVFGPFEHRIDRWPRLWNKLKFMARWHILNQERFGWFGMLDYGDWRSRFRRTHWAIWGRHGWANNSADPVFGLVFPFIIGGDAISFRMAEQKAEHYGNVDICHFTDETGRLWRNPKRMVGSGHRHGRQHWSGYLGYTGYTYPVGMCQYYLFTGEERFRDILHAMGRFLAAQRTTHGNFPDIQWIAEAFMHEPGYEPFVADLNRAIKRIRNTVCAPPKDPSPPGWPTSLRFNFRCSTDDLPGLLFYVRRHKDPEMAALFPKMADAYLDMIERRKRRGGSYNTGYHFLLPYAAYLASGDKRYLARFQEYYRKYLPTADIDIRDDMTWEEMAELKTLGRTLRTYQDIWYIRSWPYIAAALSDLGCDEKTFLKRGIRD